MSTQEPVYWYIARETGHLRKGSLILKPGIAIGIIDEQNYKDAIETYRFRDKTIRAKFEFSRGTTIIVITGEINDQPADKESLILVAKEALGFDLSLWEDITNIPESITESIARTTRKPPSFAGAPDHTAGYRW